MEGLTCNFKTTLSEKTKRSLSILAYFVQAKSGDTLVKEPIRF